MKREFLLSELVKALEILGVNELNPYSVHYEKSVEAAADLLEQHSLGYILKHQERLKAKIVEDL